MYVKKCKNTFYTCLYHGSVPTLIKGESTWIQCLDHQTPLHSTAQFTFQDTWVYQLLRGFLGSLGAFLENSEMIV